MGSRAQRAGRLSRRYLEHQSVAAHRTNGIDDKSNADPSKNPDYGYLLRGTVHDPTARRMGGVAGHAGVFSTAHDVSIYAQALLDRLAGRPSKFPLTQATLELMTTPQQPGHTAGQLQAANDAAREAIAKTPNTTDPLLAPNYPAIKEQRLFGFGWDIDTDYSKPRGLIFPIGSFGATGFTGRRCGWTQAQYLRDPAGELNPSCEAVHRSRSCAVTWLLPRLRPCDCEGEQFVDRPLVVGMLAVLGRDHRSLAVDQKVRGKAEAAVLLFHRRSAVPAESDECRATDNRAPRSGVQQCAGTRFDTEFAVEALGRIRDRRKRQVSGVLAQFIGRRMKEDNFTDAGCADLVVPACEGG